MRRLGPVDMLSLDPSAERRRAVDILAAAFAERMGDVLGSGDGRVAAVVVDEALAAGLSPADVQSLIIERAMVRIGELWESQVLTVADEHLATSISQRLLIKLFVAMQASSQRRHSGERVLLAAVQGQHHVLGLRMVADVLETAGFDVIFLGADVPVESLRSFIAEHQPSLVGLTFGISVDVAWLADSLWVVHQVAPHVRIMLGGRAVPPVLKGCYPYIANSSDVVHAVEQLLNRPPPPVPPIVETLRSGGAFPPQPETSGGDQDAAAARWARAAEDAVELARAHVRRAQTYRTLAFRDPLTDLGNRRAFEEELTGLTSSAVGGAVLMIDVDKFKAVNDEHGHAAGDRLLRSIADAIACSVRPGDIPTRVGGDEFAVLLPHASLTLAAEVGERVRAAVIESSAFHVSVSVGVSALTGDPRSALLSADIALYEAKSAGRDCVVTSHQSPATPHERL